jgi:cytochrome bd-type quinol oxidase subunit 1
MIATVVSVILVVIIIVVLREHRRWRHRRVGTIVVRWRTPSAAWAAEEAGIITAIGPRGAGSIDDVRIASCATTTTTMVTSETTTIR